MWLSDRRGFLGLLGAGALAVGGCGFRPLYGSGESGRTTLGKVAVAPPDGRLGFYMRQRLDRRLGGPVPEGKADFLLKSGISIDKVSLAITPDNAITRYRVDGAADFELTDRRTSATILKGKVSSVTAYSATGSLYATRAAERDAEKRIAEDLAERIALRVAAMQGGSEGDGPGPAAGTPAS